MSSLFESTGITVQWSDPLWYAPRVKRGVFSSEMLSYSHTLGSEWGSLDASITLLMRKEEMDEWILSGLGRDIRVTAPDLEVVFRGFVNQITVGLGGVSYSIGSMDEITNKLYCTYTGLLVVGALITNTGETEMPYAQDATSIASYGTWEKVINAGQCVIDQVSGYNEALIAQLLFLLENKNPSRSFGVSSSGDEVSLTLSVKGYYAFLGAYLYQNRITTTAATSSTYSAKISAVLAANPNTSVLNYNAALITANPALTVNKDQDYRSAVDIIQGILNGGGTAGAKWVFYYDSDNYAHYEPAETDINYVFRIAENRKQIQAFSPDNPGGLQAWILPWSIKPNKKIFLPDLVTTNSAPPSISDDMRVAYISQVRYTAPWDFEISTDKLNVFQTWLNAKGLGAA